VAFKKDTDDIREAPSIKVIRQLIEHQAIVRATDPLALENLKKIFGDKIVYTSDKFDCLYNADCCIILTEWDEYKNIKTEDFMGYMKKPCIIDARRILNSQEFVVAANYSAIGLKPSYEETIPYREEQTSQIDLDITLNNIRKEGVLIAENERYTIHDLKVDELTVSVTELKKAQETRGHSHADCSEVYFFTQGDGKIQVGNRTYYAGQGSVVTVPRGEFHKVINLGEQNLIFVTVFEGKRFSKNYDYENKTSLKSEVAEAH
jgi:mannose-6-phosphate isomerase-like protein (cupin superfamily)